MKPIYIILSILFLSSSTIAQNHEQLVTSGPMLGYNEMREVMVWIQTKNEAEVYLEYWADETPKTKTKTNTVLTQKDKAYTAHLLCSQLEPSTSYTYTVWIDKKKISFPYKLEFTTQPLWQYRTNPPNFTFALGSCTFINEKKYDRNGDPYGGGYQIFETIAKAKPDFMLWMGDNTYLREVDWNTRAGYSHRYTHTRSIPEMQQLLATTHHYAIWDDHDYGPNDANSSWVHKDIALETFNNFWANNPSKIDGVKGNTFQFQYADCDFFMLDNRFYRTEPATNGVKETMLGKKQISWLISALERSYAPFKFIVVGSPFLNTVDKYENYARYKEERADILKTIEKNKIKGVIFLTGDKHSSELDSLTLGNGQIVYDFTVSPFTSGTYDNCNIGNKNQVPNTCFPHHNFATINVSGERTKRALELKLYNTDGKLIWSYKIDDECKLSKLK